MLARVQRFFRRVRGTQLIIFLLLFGYDLYIYWGMIEKGYLGFVLLVMAVGVSCGIATSEFLKFQAVLMTRIVMLAGLFAVAIIFLERFRGMNFPWWIYFLLHIIVWFWFSAQFWLASHPHRMIIDVEQERE